MAFKASFNLTGVSVPQETFVVTRRGQDLGVRDKAATRQETVVGAQLSKHLDGNIIALQAENRANIVQTTTSHKVPRGRVANSHHPRRAKRDSVDFVGGDSIPNQQLSVLGSGDNVFVVVRPVQSVDLGQVTFQGTTDFHLAFGGGVNSASKVLHCENHRSAT